jgi:protocatechuate 3,4-dioxygenase beta subunit
MKKRDTLSRRGLLGLGLAAPLGLLAAPMRALAERCGLTPPQTTGPFYPLWDQMDKDVDLTRLTGHGRAARGVVIRVEGRVLDEQCRPVAGALVDLWQTDSNGRYAHPDDPNPTRRDPNFQGWGQATTDADGRFSFRTIKPAKYPLEYLATGTPDPNAGWRTPHIHFRVTKNGYSELATQMYFAEETELNAVDTVLTRVPAAERERVVRTAVQKEGVPPTYPFDLVVGRA